MHSQALGLLSLLSGVTSTAPNEPQPPPDAPPYNVVLIVLDDFGTDKLGFYDTSTVPPSYAATPNLDALKASGTLFRRAYAEPMCSPSRACIMTGQTPSKTGVLLAIGSGAGNLCAGVPTTDPHPQDLAFTLPATAPATSPYSYTCLPERLRTLSAPYLSGAFGKWHLADNASSNYCHPIQFGFTNFNGHMDNNEVVNASLGLNGHFGWDRVRAKRGPGGLCTLPMGLPELITEWDARQTRIDAAAWISRQVTNQVKYFAYVAFNPPHQSFQMPPLDDGTTPWDCATSVEPSNGISPRTWSEVCSAGLNAANYLPPQSDKIDGLGICAVDPMDLQSLEAYERVRIAERAAIEALDWEIGQLLAGVDYDDTVVIVVGDNGTPDALIDGTTTPTPGSSGYPYPPNHGKRFLHDLGTRVPLIIRYPGATPAETDTLVHVVDLWNTIAEIAGGFAAVDASLDSESLEDFLSGTGPATRDHVYCESANKNGWVWGVPPGTTNPKQWINIDPPPSGSGITECAPSLHRSAVKLDPGSGHFFKLIQHSPTLPPASCPESYTLSTNFCSPTHPLEELYDLTTDPNELVNLINGSGTICTIRDQLRAIADSYTGP